MFREHRLICASPTVDEKITLTVNLNTSHTTFKSFSTTERLTLISFLAPISGNFDLFLQKGCTLSAVFKLILWAVPNNNQLNPSVRSELLIVGISNYATLSKKTKCREQLDWVNSKIKWSNGLNKFVCCPWKQWYSFVLVLSKGTYTSKS